MTLITGFRASYCDHYVRNRGRLDDTISSGPVRCVYVDRVVRNLPADQGIGDSLLLRSIDRIRRSVRPRFIVRAFCVALAFVTACAFAAKPAVDDPAPDFALKSSVGKNLRLSEYRGNVVLVNFWTKSCSRCREQLDQIDRIYQDHADDRFTVLSVAITDDPHHVQEIVDGLKLTFPVLYDVRKTAARLYDPSTIPLTLLIDSHGRIRQRYSKYRRGDEDAYREQLTALLAE